MNGRTSIQGPAEHQKGEKGPPLDVPGRGGILIRGVNWLGDAVMSMPAVQRLRERFPSERITILTAEKLADVWRLHPVADEVLTFTGGEGVFTVGRRLEAHDFHTAIIFPNSPRSALEMWRGRIPKRIGYAGRWRTWCLTEAIAPPGSHAMHKLTAREVQNRLNSVPSEGPLRAESARVSAAHHVHQYLRLVGALGARTDYLEPSLRIQSAELGSVAARFGIPSGAESDARPLFSLNPGAEFGPAKRWPKESFIAAAIEIQKRKRCHWLVLGGKNDAELASEIAHGLAQGGGIGTSSIFNLAGKTNLRELCALLKLSRLLLTNDTGPMHLAAAVGTPVVVPFGSTSPELTGPLPGSSGAHRVIRFPVACSPCFRRECPVDFRCMTHIAPHAVVDAVNTSIYGEKPVVSSPAA